MFEDYFSQYDFPNICVIGKSPLFEIRRMQFEANDPLKSTPTFDEESREDHSSADNTGLRNDIESDEENIVHHSSKAKSCSTNQSTRKRSSPVSVYTYKVNILTDHSGALQFSSFLPHCTMALLSDTRSVFFSFSILS